MDFYVPYESYLQEYRYKYLALFHALRAAILDGTVPNGTKLPASREMAAMYQLSRGSVNQVYEMLMSEGYVSTEVGRGTFVQVKPTVRQCTSHETVPIRLSEWGMRIMRLQEAWQSQPHDRATVMAAEPDEISFEMGRVSIDHFPTEMWNRALHGEVRRMVDSQRWEAFASEGHLPLREAIALHLRRMRGIQTGAEEIMIFNGSMQALALLSHLLIREGDRVVVENPGYLGIRRAILAAGGHPLPQAVDDQGIMPQDWEERLLFVTPTRQFPTGAVLSLERRQQLLAWASRRDAVIVEDDYDSEFRYGGRPIEPLKTLDREDRVVYVGTFSKTMYSDLRIGYAVLPRSLVAPMRLAKELYEPHPPSLLEQRALAVFMNSGGYERHLRRMRRVYGRNARLFYQQLSEQLGDLFQFTVCDAGLHLYATWRKSAGAYEAFRQAAAQHGVRWTGGGGYQHAAARPAACFGFSHLTEEQIAEGVRRLKMAWDSMV